jgi:hypothetical protein
VQDEELLVKEYPEHGLHEITQMTKVRTVFSISIPEQKSCRLAIKPRHQASNPAIHPRTPDSSLHVPRLLRFHKRPLPCPPIP